MGRIKTDVLREEPIGITAKIIDGIKGIFAVMPPCTSKIHQEREFALNRAFLKQSI